MRWLASIFDYVKPAWEGRDGKVSIRSALAIAFSVNFIINITHAVYKWDIGGASFEGLSLVLGIEAGLIAGLLGLTTYQNIMDKKTDANVDIKAVEITKKDVRNKRRSKKDSEDCIDETDPNVENRAD
jgi:hypothetical protein